MRKAIGLALVLALALTAFIAVPASAGLNDKIAKWEAKSVSIAENELCWLYDGNQDVVPGDRVKYTFGKTYLITCQARGVANDSGRWVRFNYENTGELCIGENGDTTTRWKNTVNHGGRAFILCRFSN